MEQMVISLHGIQELPCKVKGTSLCAHTHTPCPPGKHPPLSVLSFEHSPLLLSDPHCFLPVKRGL
ncbi:hypothetical protein EXN66_Car007786 [Channa argus]|uniref:Uncharacterized protein n=1 Tax=Channa argus TaxID=215402 RepID=A0A6G1PP77_CHAAH|nr:hypothetical protein EXN66_Car007786 [Channa argus]